MDVLKSFGEKEGPPSMRTLDLLAPGESATIARLEGDPGIARRLMEL